MWMQLLPKAPQFQLPAHLQPLLCFLQSLMGQLGQGGVQSSTQRIVGIRHDHLLLLDLLGCCRPCGLSSPQASSCAGNLQPAHETATPCDTVQLQVQMCSVQSAAANPPSAPFQSDATHILLRTKVTLSQHNPFVCTPAATL